MPRDLSDYPRNHEGMMALQQDCIEDGFDIESARYEVEAGKLCTPYDDRHKVNEWADAMMDFIVAARKLDRIKRLSFYAKKPGAAYDEKNMKELQRLTLMIESIKGIPMGDLRVDRDIQHAIIGISTEAGEMVELMVEAMHKRDGSFDFQGFFEEEGDSHWYHALGRSAARRLGQFQFTLRNVLMGNLRKLLERYKQGPQASGGERDLSAEKKAMTPKS